MPRSGPGVHTSFRYRRYDRVMEMQKIQDPPLARALFSDVRWSWIWLILRVYVGWQWLSEGIEKAQTPAWVGAQAGSFLTVWVTKALTKTQGAHPDVQGWYGAFFGSIVLPHAVAYNARATQPAMARIAAALGTDDAAMGLYDLAGRIGAKRALKDIGMPEAGVARAAELALANPYWNPRPLELEAIERLIARAWSGAPPDPAI